MATKDPIALAVGDQASATGVFPEDHKRQKKRPPKWVRVLRLVKLARLLRASRLCRRVVDQFRSGRLSGHDPSKTRRAPVWAAVRPACRPRGEVQGWWHAGGAWRGVLGRIELTAHELKSAYWPREAPRGG